jgi:hypothetical protein
MVRRESDTLAAELVIRDVLLGLGDSFQSDDGPRITDATLSNGESTAVTWEYECVHSGLFQGLNPTGKRLTIRGITIIANHLDDEKGASFARYIDWSQVMTDLGMYASYRPTIATTTDPEP